MATSQCKNVTGSGSIGGEECPLSTILFTGHMGDLVLMDVNDRCTVGNGGGVRRERMEGVIGEGRRCPFHNLGIGGETGVDGGGW